MILRYANHVQTQTPTCAKVQQTKISHGKLFPSKCKPQNLGDSKEFCIILSWHILFLCVFYVPHIPGSICWSQVSGQEKVYTLKKSLQWFTWLCPPMYHSNLNSKSILEAAMASMHRRLACDGEAGGGGAAGASRWRPQAAPSRRAGSMISVTITILISESYDIRSCWYLSV